MNIQVFLVLFPFLCSTRPKALNLKMCLFSIKNSEFEIHFSAGVKDGISPRFIVKLLIAYRTFYKKYKWNAHCLYLKISKTLTFFNGQSYGRLLIRWTSSDTIRVTGFVNDAPSPSQILTSNDKYVTLFFLTVIKKLYRFIRLNTSCFKIKNVFIICCPFASVANQHSTFKSSLSYVWQSKPSKYALICEIYKRFSKRKYLKLLIVVFLTILALDTWRICTSNK